MVAKNYHLCQIVGRANILSKYIVHIFFNFGRGCCGSFPMLFPKAPASYCKKNFTQFLLHSASIVLSSKSVSQIFKILFQTADFNIFVLHVVFFSRYVLLKSWRKTSAVTYFSRDAIENQRGKVFKKNSKIGRSWSSAKLFIVQNYTENVNGYVPLTVENV